MLIMRNEPKQRRPFNSKPGTVPGRSCCPRAYGPRRERGSGDVQQNPCEIRGRRRGPHLVGRSAARPVRGARRYLRPGWPGPQLVAAGAAKPAQRAACRLWQPPAGRPGRGQAPCGLEAGLDGWHHTANQAEGHRLER